jgi:tRNA C32,U32 (ribose-2'-O)-methylase TrmJ
VESLNVAQAATVMCYEWLRRVSAEESMAVEPTSVDYQVEDVMDDDGGSFMVDAAASFDVDWDL